MPLGRRAMLVGGGAALLGAAVPLSRIFARKPAPPSPKPSFGPLVRDPAGLFDLPAGFVYRVVQREGERMSDGYRVPQAFDGMACFQGPDGTIVLMRNHENTWFFPAGACYPGQPVPAEAYNRSAQGGVTRVVLRADTLRVVSSNLVLAGTLRNCAGGPSPWGWLSCEESSDRNHGYVFRCPVEAERVAPWDRLTGYGRFRHEAVCVDPTTSVAYLTEDRDDGCLYRFVPHAPGRPFEGRLEALAVAGHPRMDTGVGLDVGATFEARWVPLPPQGPEGDTLRHDAGERGAAVVRRGEGIWFDKGRVFVCSTSGGPRGAGQIFRLSVGGDKPDRVELIAQSSDTAVLDMPDNITVAPWGDVVMAEDSVGGDQFLRFLSPEGDVFDFARNAKSMSELAGVCFSPSGDTLFVNIYGDGLTLAVRGPFQSAQNRS